MNWRAAAVTMAGSAEKQPKGIEGGSIKPVLLNGGRGVVQRHRFGLHFYRGLDSMLILDGHKLATHTAPRRLDFTISLKFFPKPPTSPPPSLAWPSV